MEVSNMEMKYLRSLSNAIDDYIKQNRKPNQSDGIFNLIERILPHVTPNQKYKVKLVYINETTDPFIMSVYPDMTQLSNRAQAIINRLLEQDLDNFMKEWGQINEYVIEIDSRVLTPGDSLCVDDGDQFVGMLCHEIGHALVANPLATVQSYMAMQGTISKALKLGMSKNPLVRKFCLPMFVALNGFKIIIKNSTKGVDDEIRADHYIPTEYREAVIAYFDNHILNNPQRSRFIISKEDAGSIQTTACTFSASVVSLVKTRRTALKNSVKAQYDKGTSPYIRNLCQKIGKEAMGYDPENDETNAVYESSMMRCFESSVTDCEKEARLTLETANVSARDIAILQVQIDDINTSEQKLFVVHTIYDYIEILQDKREKILKKCKGDIGEARKYTTTYDSQITQLNQMLEKVMKIDTSGDNRKFGIYIRYPKGYEG